MEPTRHMVEGFDGQALNVWDYGGDGPNLLLCHCTGGLARLWDPVAEILAGDFRLIAPDTRGHGDSSLPKKPEACDWINSGRDLLAVCRHFDLGGDTLAAGHSAGGAHVAFAEYLQPGSFARAVLIDAIIGPRAVFGRQENPLADGARRRRNFFDSVDEARERLGAKPPKNRWDAQVFELYLRHGLVASPDGTVALKLPGEWEAYFYEYGGACEVFEHLDALRLPVLVATAENSTHIRHIARMQHEALPQSAFADMPKAHHFIPQEAPAETAELLRAWFLDQSIPAVYAAS